MTRATEVPVVVSVGSMVRVARASVQVGVLVLTAVVEVVLDRRPLVLASAVAMGSL